MNPHVPEASVYIIFMMGFTSSTVLRIRNFVGGMKMRFEERHMSWASCWQFTVQPGQAL